MNDEKMTVREACRQRYPLGGADAQALEHGMTQLESENKKMRQMYDDAMELVGALRHSLWLLSQEADNSIFVYDESRRALDFPTYKKQEWEIIVPPRACDRCAKAPATVWRTVEPRSALCATCSENIGLAP